MASGTKGLLSASGPPTTPEPSKWLNPSMTEDIYSCPKDCTLWIGEWQSTNVPTIRGNIKLFLRDVEDKSTYDTLGCLEFNGCFKKGKCEPIRPTISHASDASGKADMTRPFSCTLKSLSEDKKNIIARYEIRIPQYDAGIVNIKEIGIQDIVFTKYDPVYCVIS
jgi:hypothetical protein